MNIRGRQPVYRRNKVTANKNWFTILLNFFKNKFHRVFCFICNLTECLITHCRFYISLQVLLHIVVNPCIHQYIFEEIEHNLILVHPKFSKDFCLVGMHCHDEPL